jgi:hypothetical protein
MASGRQPPEKPIVPAFQPRAPPILARELLSSEQLRFSSSQPTHRRDILMTKLVAILVVLASFLLVAPVIESGAPGPIQVFQAVGNAEDGGGG